MKYLLILICSLQSYCVVGQMDTTSNLSVEEKLYGLSLFWKEAAYNFAYFDKTNINWDSTYKAFISRIAGTRNTYSYYRVLQEFCALLKDGHTNINLPGSLQKGDINVDIGFVYLDHKVYNTSIARKDSALVPPGSELITINDIPTLKFLQQEIFPFVSYSAIHQLYNTAIRRIISPPIAWNNTPVHLTFRTPAGKIVPYDAYTNPTTREWASIPNQIQHNRFFTMLPGNIAYLLIRHFGDTSVVTEFRKYLPELYKASGVIIDLRYNGGGSSDVGVAILKYFTHQKKIRGAAWKTPDYLAAFNAWGRFFTLADTTNKNQNDQEWIRKAVRVAHGDNWYYGDAEAYDNDLEAPRIEAPLVVLIGNETASAAEDFLISLDDLHGRGTTIGERSYGSTGQPLYFDLPGGGTARICTKRDTYPDGREFVGYGIQPDIEVKRTIEDLVSGKDACLARALEFLTQSQKKANK